MSAAVRHLETDSNANQDISSALAIGVYTADADRLVLPQLFADQVAGNGDYIAYATLQIAGAGSHYRLIPITTAAAASGLTAIGAQGVAIGMESGDVLTVYIQGLAGDTTTPDVKVRFFEHAALRPAVADRVLGVDASNRLEGIAGTINTLDGLDTAQDVEHDATQALINALNDLSTAQVQAIIDALDTAQDAEHDATQAAIAALNDLSEAQVQAIADALDTAQDSQHATTQTAISNLNDLSEAEVQAIADALDAAQDVEHDATQAAIAALVSGASEAQVQAIIDAHDAAQDVEHDATQAAIAGLSIPTLTAIVNAVLDELLSAHTIPGSVAAGISDASAASATPDEIQAEVWANAPSTVTAVLVTGLSAGTLTLIRGDRWDFDLTGLGSLTGATDTIFTIKANKDDPDSAALVQIRDTANLVTINRTAAGDDSGNGSLTVDDAAAGDITITLEGVETAKLHPGEYFFDVQRVGAAGDPVTRTEGKVNLTADVTRAVL